MPAGSVDPPLDTVDRWLLENQPPDPGPWWGRLRCPRESVVGGVFLVWGMLLLIGTVFGIVLGWSLMLAFPALAGWWATALLLGAVGAWLAFELSNDEGFEVRRERAPAP